MNDNKEKTAGQIFAEGFKIGFRRGVKDGLQVPLKVTKAVGKAALFTAALPFGIAAALVDDLRRGSSGVSSGTAPRVPNRGPYGTGYSTHHAVGKHHGH